MMTVHVTAVKFWCDVPWLRNYKLFVSENLSGYLGAERLWGLQHVKQLWVVNLQQHASNLACQAGMHVLDQWEQTLTYERDGEDLESKAINPRRRSGKCLTRRNHSIRSECRQWSSPSICFCSCGGAAASMEAVRGSCPWTWTAGWVVRDTELLQAQL